MQEEKAREKDGETNNVYDSIFVAWIQLSTLAPANIQ